MGPDARQQLRKRFAASLLLLLVIAIPLGVIMASTLRDASRQRAVEAALVQRLADTDSHLVALEIDRDNVGLLIVATVRSTQPSDAGMVDDLAEALSVDLDQPIRLEMVVLPVVRSGGE